MLTDAAAKRRVMLFNCFVMGSIRVAGTSARGKPVNCLVRHQHGNRRGLQHGAGSSPEQDLP
jgi:hypothetical protein